MPKIVILIEDEANIRSVYSEMLKTEGFEVVEISDGDEGLDTLKTDSWDLLLLDLMLPKKDGVELLKDIQNDPKAKNRPVLVVTNLNNEDLKNTCMQLGAKEYLVKSDITPGDLVTNVKKYVSDN